MFVFGRVQRLASVLQTASGIKPKLLPGGAFIAPLQVETCSAVAVDHAIGRTKNCITRALEAARNPAA